MPACGEAGCGGAGGSAASCSSSWIAASTSLDSAAAAVLGDGARGRRLGAVAAAHLEREDRRALLDLVADGDLDRRDLAGARRGDLHRRLVGLEDHQRVLGGDLVADRDEDLDHGYVVEVPDVRDQDLFGASHRRLPQTRHGAGRSVSMP